MKYPDTGILRAIALVLIFNSHMYDYYPISFIATGGAIGNSLFFFLSGYGIYESYKKKTKQFSHWIGDRINRIYPAVWIVVICIYLPLKYINGQLPNEDILSVFGILLCPPYWFLDAIIIFYIISYIILKRQSRFILILLFSIEIIYFIYYFNWIDLDTFSIENLPFKIIHYYFIFILGFYIASIKKSIKYSGVYDIAILLLSISGIYIHKYMMSINCLQEMQFIQQILMIPVVIYFLKVSRSDFIMNIMNKNRIIYSVTKFISDHTLEIYILQETIKNQVLKLNTPFPINVIILMLLCYMLSLYVSKLSKIIEFSLNKQFSEIRGQSA
jgi:peptidoglycan/LPS O-acetylase OafA/YrhL